MKITRTRLALALIASTVLSSPGFAQTPTPEPLTPPSWQSGNGSIPGTPFVATGNGATSGASNAKRFSRLQNLLDDFGAACDNSTDDTSKVNTAAQHGTISIPGISTLCKTTISSLAMPNSDGPGRLIDSVGNYRAPITRTLSAAPAAYGNPNLPGTAFNGDLTSVPFAVQKIITGVATLGQPTTGYNAHPETAPYYLSVLNESGWNQQTSGNDGRTGTVAMYLRLDQYGQGDVGGISCHGVVASFLPGATHYLASPAIGCYSGAVFGGHNGAFIELMGDLDITDNGFDIAGVGEALNFDRSNAHENLSVNWTARYIGIVGSAPIDHIDAVNGPLIAGYDLTNATMGYYRLAGYTINSGGSTCVEGTPLTVSGGTVIPNGTPTIFYEHCTGSAVSSLTITSPTQSGNTGIYSTPPVTSYTTLTLTGAAGTDADIAGQYTANSVMLLPSAGGCIRPGVYPGSPGGEMSGVYSSLCIDQGGMTFGGLNSARPTTAGSNNFMFGDHLSALGSGNFFAGLYAYDEAQTNGFYLSGGSFNGEAGGSQKSLRILRGIGASGTIVLTSDASGATTGRNSYLAPPTSNHNIVWRCNASDQTTNANVANWYVPRSGAFVRNGSGVPTYVTQGSTTLTPDSSAGTGGTATIAITVDGAHNVLVFTFSAPSAGDTWRVQCDVDADQLLGV